MNRYALITGATGGLGQTVSHMLAQSGWSLALVSREPTRLERHNGEPSRAIIDADVSTPEGAQEALRVCLSYFGRPPDGLAHCAGNTLIMPLHRTRVAQYRECISANLDSAFFTLAAYVDALLSAKQHGSAVLISSVVARVGVGNHEAIAAAKGAIEALTRSAAATYAPHGIRVNAVAPGLMRTPLTERLFINERAEAQIASQYPLGRYGEAQDVANAVAWLLSDQAGWVTGHVLPVDGGFAAVRPAVKARA